MGYTDMIKGNLYYLTINEPLKFAKELAKGVKEAQKAGFNVELFFGGPEAFPVHIYKNGEFEEKKAQVMIHAVGYWSRMAVNVEGKDENSNKEEAEKIITEIKDQIQIHD
ncbi:MAG TPA: hypothetical protein ENN55_03880 [Firmicutes bacterium]|nr:hypothetical protein [Bacillota bacterium]